MIHVGMNVEDKPALFTGVHRVLKQGGTFAVFDVMRTREGELSYPVPWAQAARRASSPAPRTIAATWKPPDSRSSRSGTAAISRANSSPRSWRAPPRPAAHHRSARTS
jgi:hypothetical protein